jgi:glyoxylase-like metal-dependent hydrolase (beta-lactamase superfamily II)
MEVLTRSTLAYHHKAHIHNSHAHIDHIGRPSLFPTTTELIVGPGIKQAFFPGYPTATDSPTLSREFAGREVTELSVSQFNLDIGGLKALDHFSDGSFYLLSAPGHAIGHLNALARTTENTFIYLAGDSIHHLSELRPHPASHLPQSVPLRGRGHCCSGAAFHAIHPLSDITTVPKHYHEALGYPNSTPDTSPFFTVSQKPTGETLASNIADARATIKAVQRFDADENVFVVAAHDGSIRGILDSFPNKANDWKLKGLKEKGCWLFLNDFEEALKISGTEVGVGAGTA